MHEVAALTGILVPLIVFGAITIMVVAKIYFNNKEKAERHRTLQKALESGQQLSPEMMRLIEDDVTSKTRNYLRRAIIWIAIGAGIAGFGLVDGDLDVIGIALIPLCVGLGFLAVWKLDPAANGADERR